jgi:hypothetical protein
MLAILANEQCSLEGGVLPLITFYLRLRDLWTSADAPAVEGILSLEIYREAIRRAEMLSVCYYMVSLWRRTNPKSASKFWIACWPDSLGRQRRASTKKTDRKEAQKVAEEYEEVSLGNKSLQQIQETLI